MYAGFTSVVIILFSLYMNFLAAYMQTWVLLLGFIVFFFYFFSYTGVFLINPGFPKKKLKEEIQLNKALKYCPHCRIYYEPKKHVVHCLECNICVEGYDHHCPWTGKCIGSGNIMLFYLFLSSIFILFFYFVFAFIFTVDEIESSNRRNRHKLM